MRPDDYDKDREKVRDAIFELVFSSDPNLHSMGVEALESLNRILLSRRNAIAMNHRVRRAMRDPKKVAAARTES